VSPALAFAAAAAAVVGVWELLAAVERTRVAAFFARVVDPVIRAGAEPTAIERRRFAVLAAGVLAAAGWFVGGVALALVTGVTGPLIATALVRGRRHRLRAALAAAAPNVARALADALSGGHSVRGALTVVASGVPGHELHAAASALQFGASTEAVLERLRRQAGSPGWDAMVAGILLQRDAGGDLPNLLRDLAAALDAAARQDRDALAATSQARFTARVVLVLPLGAAILAELAHPGLLGGLLTNPISAVLTCFALAFQIVALIAVAQLTRNVAR
jgi:tight adherence protein B